MSAPPGKEMFLDALRSEAAALRGAVAGTDLDAPVPPCPGWSVHRLVGHLGAVYAMMLDVVTRGARGDLTPPERRSRTDAPAGADVLTEFDARLAGLLEALTAAPPDAPTWNWAGRPAVAAFWHRRAAHETAVHRWDAQASTGLPHPVTTALAADGVSEVLDTWLPSGRRKGPADLDGVARLVSTDADVRWAVRVRGEGISLLDTGTVLDSGPGAQVRATGTASDLLLALYGRVPYEVLTVEGDAPLLAALRTG